MIVVDLGCADYGTQDSLSSLADTYHPTRMYGFDPHPALDETVTCVHGIPTRLERKAAWLYDGETRFIENITRSHLANGQPDATVVPCFDFSAWLSRRRTWVILKMDIEGAEYEVLERMISDGTDQKIAALLIEWHDGDRGLTDRLACPVHEWWM